MRRKNRTELKLPWLAFRSAQNYKNMISSSNFFNKSFFTIEQPQVRAEVNELAPWNLSPSQEWEISTKIKSSDLNAQSKRARVLEIEKNSTREHIERKLRANSLANRSRDKSGLQRQNSPKIFTIQQKLKLVNSQTKRQNQPVVLPSLCSQSKARKRSPRLFPEITVHQYNELRAKGSGIYSNNSNEEMVSKRKNRRRFVEEFQKGINGNARLSSKELNKTINERPVMVGRYVYAVKNPQFSVQGLPTTKMIQQF